MSSHRTARRARLGGFAGSPVLRSTLAILAGSAATILAAFVTRVLLARRLGPEGFGAFTQAVAIATAIGGSAALGLGTAGARRVSLLRAQGEAELVGLAARTALVVGALSGAVCALLLALGTPWLARAVDKPDLIRPLWALLPIVIALPVGTAGLGVARAFQNVVGRALWRDAAGGVLRVAGVLIALAAGAGPTGAALGFALGTLGGELTFLRYSVARGWWRAPASGSDAELLRALPPYAGMAVLAQAAQWFDVLLLGAVAPAAAVGGYGVARGLERVLELASDAGAHRFLPHATQVLHRSGPTALDAAYRQARRVMLTLLWPPLLLCLLAPADLLVAVFGARYAAAAPSLRLLATGLLFSAALGYNDRALLAAGEERAVARITSLSVLCGILVGLLAIPSHGPTGAAAAWLVMITLQNALCTLRLRRQFGVSPSGRDLLEFGVRAGGPPLALFVALAWILPSPLPRALLASFLAAAAGLWAWRERRSPT